MGIDFDSQPAEFYMHINFTSGIPFIHEPAKYYNNLLQRALFSELSNVPKNSTRVVQKTFATPVKSPDGCESYARVFTR